MEGHLGCYRAPCWVGQVPEGQQLSWSQWVLRKPDWVARNHIGHQAEHLNGRNPQPGAALPGGAGLPFCSLERGELWERPTEKRLVGGVFEQADS